MIAQNQMKKKAEALNHESICKISSSCLASVTAQILQRRQLLSLVQNKLRENNIQSQQSYSFSGVGLAFALKKQVGQSVGQQIYLINKIFQEIFQSSNKFIHQNMRQSPKQSIDKTMTKIAHDINVFKSVFVSIVINEQKPFLELLELFTFQEHQKYTNEQVQAIKQLSNLIFEALNEANDLDHKQQNFEQSSSMVEEGESQVETATYGIQTLIQNLDEPQSMSSLNAPFRFEVNRHLEIPNSEFNLPLETNVVGLWRAHSQALTLDYGDYAFREANATDVQMIDLTFYETRSSTKQVSLLESDVQSIS